MSTGCACRRMLLLRWKVLQPGHSTVSVLPTPATGYKRAIRVALPAPAPAPRHAAAAVRRPIPPHPTPKLHVPLQSPLLRPGHPPPVHHRAPTLVPQRILNTTSRLPRPSLHGPPPRPANAATPNRTPNRTSPTRHPPPPPAAAGAPRPLAAHEHAPYPVPHSKLMTTSRPPQHTTHLPLQPLLVLLEQVLVAAVVVLAEVVLVHFAWAGGGGGVKKRARGGQREGEESASQAGDEAAGKTVPATAVWGRATTP